MGKWFRRPQVLPGRGMSPNFAGTRDRFSFQKKAGVIAGYPALIQVNDPAVVRSNNIRRILAKLQGRHTQGADFGWPHEMRPRGLDDMRKKAFEKFGAHLVSDVSRVIRGTDRAVHAALEHHHLSRWHPASTAPYNQDLELRVTEDGAVTTMPFPCRHTNEDEWINVDLGVPLRIQPVEWRAWQQSKPPHPHQSSIFAPGTSAARRLEQRGWPPERQDNAEGDLPSKREI